MRIEITWIFCPGRRQNLSTIQYINLLLGIKTTIKNPVGMADWGFNLGNKNDTRYHNQKKSAPIPKNRDKFSVPLAPIQGAPKATIIHPVWSIINSYFVIRNP